jgi:hypothetical protein
MAFIREILSSDSEQGSFSRLTGLMIALALIVWASIIVWRTGTIPDIPAYWALTLLGLYGINKSMEAAKNMMVTWRGNGSEKPVQ